jgi:hypothetical protein
VDVFVEVPRPADVLADPVLDGGAAVSVVAGSEDGVPEPPV